VSRLRDVVVSAAFAVFMGLLPASAFAGGAGPLEGTWGGADAHGRTAQIIVAGDSVIGVYWIDDYHDAANPRFSQGGARLDFELAGRKAALVRAGTGARITVREPNGAEISINLKKD